MKKSILLLSLVFIFLLFTNRSLSQPNGKDTSWNKMNFLLGDWIGEGSGKPGEGAGYFSFKFDLNKNILIRKNHTEYPAIKDRPAFNHDDLLIVYTDYSGIPNRAIYFDNEGHVINYSISTSRNPESVIFLSDLIPNVPRFKLSYIQDPGKLKIVFEIAPPSKPDSFSKYLEGTAHKK